MSLSSSKGKEQKHSQNRGSGQNQEESCSRVSAAQQSVLGFRTGSRAYCEGSWFQVESFRCREMGNAHVGHHPSLHSTIASLDEDNIKNYPLQEFGLKSWILSVSPGLVESPSPIGNYEKNPPSLQTSLPFVPRRSCSGGAGPFATPVLLWAMRGRL